MVRRIGEGIVRLAYWLGERYPGPGGGGLYPTPPPGHVIPAGDPGASLPLTGTIPEQEAAAAAQVESDRVYYERENRSPRWPDAPD